MKKAVGIAAIVVFFLILLVLLGIKLFAGSSKPAPIPQTVNPFGDIPVTAVSQSQDPAQFSHDFYSWYLSNVVGNPTFPTDEELSTKFSKWLTPTFITSWHERSDRIYADPVLYAQDFPANWGGKITARIVQQVSFAATVEVMVGDTANEHKYTVHLLRSQGEWLIDSIDGTL